MKKNICRAVCSCCRWGRGACSTAWWCTSSCTRWGSGTSRAGSTGTISTISISIISTISIQGPVRHRALGQHPAGDGGSVRQVSGCQHYFKNKILNQNLDNSWPGLHGVSQLRPGQHHALQPARLLRQHPPHHHAQARGRGGGGHGAEAAPHPGRPGQGYR